MTLTLEEVPEMVADWRAGELLRDQVYELCLDMLAVHEVEDVLALLPAVLRDDFEAAMQAEFGGDTPAEEFIWFSSGAGDNPGKVRIIGSIRAWLARRSDAAAQPTAPDSSQVEEAVARYQSGETSRGDLHGELFALLRQHPVDGLLDALPVELRVAFVDWLKETYDNDLAPEEFLWISNAGRPAPDHAILVSRVRAWLRTGTDRS